MHPAFNRAIKLVVHLRIILKLKEDAHANEIKSVCASSYNRGIKLVVHAQFNFHVFVHTE